MSAGKDGGPAFPSHVVDATSERGMSLRDWFAGLAMQALLANPEYDQDRRERSKAAFEQADAMIEARAKR